MIRYKRYTVVRKQGVFPWDAVASGVGAIVGGIVSRKNNKDNIKMQRETNQMQMDMFQRQLDYNLAAEKRARGYAIEDFNMENAYNSPLAQRERYEAAGLNPALMMRGQGSAVGQIEATGGAQAPSAPHLDAPRSEDWLSPMIDRSFQYFRNFLEFRKEDEVIKSLVNDNQFKALYNQKQIEEITQKIRNMAKDETLKEWERKELEKKVEILDDTSALNALTFDSRAKSQTIMNYYYDSLGRKLNEEAIAEGIRNRFLESKEILSLGLSRAQLNEIVQSVVESKSRVGVNNSMAAKLALEAAGIDPDTPQGKQFYAKLEAEISKLNRTEISIGSDFFGNVKTSHPAMHGAYNKHDPLKSYRTSDDVKGKKGKYVRLKNGKFKYVYE